MYLLSLIISIYVAQCPLVKRRPCCATTYSQQPRTSESGTSEYRDKHDAPKNTLDLWCINLHTTYLYIYVQQHTRSFNLRLYNSQKQNNKEERKGNNIETEMFHTTIYSILYSVKHQLSTLLMQNQKCNCCFSIQFLCLGYLMILCLGFQRL